jgi:hypothetical protein
VTEPTEASPNSGSQAVAEFVRRVPLIVWPFVVLAGLRTAVFLINVNGQLSIVLLLMLASYIAWAMLPAAVLLGCPTAWRSARGVTVGVMVWSTVGVAYALVLGVTAFLGPQWPGPDGLWPFHVLVQVAEIAGPAIVALYLGRRRETSTTWPIPLILVALVGTALICFSQASNAIDWYNSRQVAPWAFQDEWGDRAQVLIQTVSPLGLLMLSVLAWSGLSAYRAGEGPEGFWPLITAGTAALIVADAWGYAVAAALQIGLLAPSFYIDSVQRLGELFLALSVVGIVLLLLAFARGLPEDAIDLGGVIDVAPEARAETAAEPT